MNETTTTAPPACRNIRVRDLQPGARLWRPAALAFTTVNRVIDAGVEIVIETSTGRIIGNRHGRALVAKVPAEADVWNAAREATS